MSIDNNQFYNNSATGSKGGAVFISDSLAVFSGVNIFTENKVEAGGENFKSNSNVSFV